MAESAIENKDSGGIVVILIAAWSVGLLVAFFAYRGSDIGQLQTLIGNLGGGPLAGDGAYSSLVGIVVSVFIYQAWVGTGIFVYRLLGFEIKSVAFALATAAAIGAAIWSLIFFLLGLTGLYYPWIAIAAVVVGTILFMIRFGPVKGFDREFKFWRGLSGAEWSIVVLIAFVLAISLIGALAPPVAKDTLLYHFALPKTYVAQHGLSFVEGNIASYIPMGNEMHGVWAMLLGGLFNSRAAEAAAGAVNFLFFPILLLAIYGWMRELGLDRKWSLLAVLIVASVPSAFHVASSAYIDLGLALYTTLAIAALGRWWREQKRSDLILITIYLGAALSIKLTAVFIFAAFALIILLRARNDKEAAGKIIIGGVAALVVAAAIASPWYLRTWRATGSPVFPFYMSIWKGEAANWDVERSNLFQGMNAQYGGDDKGVFDYVFAPVKLSVTAQPEIATNFDGVLGVAFLIGLPLLIWGLWKFELPIEVKIGAGVAGVMFLFWLFSSQQLRYLLPILPVLAIGIVASAEAISQKIGGVRSILPVSLAAASVAGVLVSCAWFLQTAPLRVVLGGESRDEYLTRNLDYYPYYEWLNTQSTSDAKVWLINMRRDTYNLDRPVISDYLFEDWTLRKMVWEARSVQELKAKAAAMGIKYVLTRHDFLFDYSRSTIVDDQKPRAENEAKLKMTKDFILDPTNTIRSDNRFSLIKVFSEK
jgi:hypothetical protein